MAKTSICAQLLGLYAAILPLVTPLGCPAGDPQPQVVQADLGGRVRLDCNLQGSWKHIYWQRGDRPDSTHEKFVNGVSENKLPTTDFMNRSTVDRRNGTMELWDLKLRDSKYYLCLQVSDDACKRSLYHLNVTARYTQPALTNHSRDDGLLEVTCSTWGGFPRSDIQWLMSAENSSTGWRRLNQTELQDPTDHLWTLSSTIALNCTLGLRISCVVGDSASDELKIKACPPMPLFPPIVIIAIAVLVVPFIIVFLIFLVKILKRAPSTNEHVDTVL